MADRSRGLTGREAREPLDVLVIGAGPAGAVAATLLARAGARVALVDRARFPRSKLCGDTLNPGALSELRHHDLAPPEDMALRIHGMVVTGGTTRLGEQDRNARVTRIVGRYPNGLYGLALSRRHLDSWLVEQAIAAGARFESPLAVTTAIVRETRLGLTVVGARVHADRGERELRARVTIAADGRRSRIAMALGLLRHSLRPRRWAIGAYFDRAQPASTGEMHVRANGYIGLAPLPGGGVNACVVSADVMRSLRNPTAFLVDALRADPGLRDRVADAQIASPVGVLGPLAVESTGVAHAGLLTAGDAAGFIDPITGDGLRFAIHGGALAADAALCALTHGWEGVHSSLTRARDVAFASKWRFNRALRTLTASPRALQAAALGAWVLPSVVRTLISHAGDVPVARWPSAPSHERGRDMSSALPRSW